MGTSVRPWVNPYAPKKKEWVNPYQQTIGDNFASENPDDSSEEDIPTKLGHLAGYLGSLAKQTVTHPINTLGSFLDPTQGYKAGLNLDARLTEAHNKLVDFSNKPQVEKDTFFRDEIKKGVSGLASNLGNGDFLAGAAKGLADYPISAINDALTIVTGFKNDKGTARPATPDEMGSATLSTLGNIAFGKLAEAIHTNILGDVSKLDASGIIKTSKISYRGRLAKQITADVPAAMAGAGAQTAISNADKDDILSKTIAQTLSAAPLGVLLAPLTLRSRDADIKVAKDNLARRSIDGLNDLNAARTLKIAANESLESVTSKVAAVATGDDLLETAVKARVNVNNGLVIPDVGAEKFAELSNNPEVSAGFQPSYSLHPALEKAGVTYKGIDLNFDSPFDRVVYHLTTKKKSAKNYRSYLVDAMDQTGLTEPELMNHGKKVRATVKSYFDAGNIRPKSALELATADEGMINRGREIISNTLDGGEVVASDGSKWNRKGNLFTDGTRIYPKDSQDLARTLGMKDKNSNLSPTTIDVPTHPYENTFSKADGSPSYFYYHPASETAFVSGVRLNEATQKFFERTGFLPGECVVHNGQEYSVLNVDAGKAYLESVQTGHWPDGVPVGDLVRPNRGINTTQVEGSNVYRVGKLTSTSYFQSLFDEFVDAQVNPQNQFARQVAGKEKAIARKEQKGVDASKQRANLERYLKQDPINSFDKQFHSFMDSKGVDYKDRTYAVVAFAKMLQDEVSKRLTPEDKLGFDAISGKFNDYYKRSSFDFATRLHNQLASAGAIIDNAGGGMYHVVDSDGTRLGTVGSLEEVREVLAKGGQSNLVDLDGAGTGGVHSAVANIGINQPWAPKVGGFQKFNDRALTNRVTNYFTPSQNLFSRLDDRLGTTDLTTYSRNLQKAQIVRRNWINDKLSPLMDLYKGITSSQKKVSPDRLEHIAAAVETMNRDELETSAMSRPMNVTEIGLSKQVSQLVAKSTGTMNDVANVMEKMRDVEKAKGVKYGTPEWQNEYSALGTFVGKAKDPQITQAVDLLYKARAIGDPNLMSTYIVMRHAAATLNPDAALSRADYMTRYNFTPVEVKLVGDIGTLLDRAGDTFGIGEKSRLKGYLPIMKQMYAATDFAADPKAEFVHEYRRQLGSEGFDGSGKQAIRNPSELVYRYLSSGANVFSGFNDLVKTADGNVREALDNYVNDPTKPNRGLVTAIYDKVDTHTRNVRGVPDPTSHLAGLPSQLAVKLGIRSGDAVNQLMYTSLLGGFRWALAARDLSATMMYTYSHFGAVFSSKVFGDVITAKYVNALADRGILPKDRVADFTAPDSENYLSGNSSVLGKVSAAGFKMSGQDQVYVRSTAAVFKTSEDLNLDVLGDLVRNKIDKETAYNKMHLDMHSAAVQVKFDSLVESNQLTQAAEFLAKENTKKMVNTFGMHNNPVGWSSPIGRTMGALNSWNANALQTFIDMASNGSLENRAKRMLRFSVAMGALGVVNHYSDVDLSSWYMNPFKMVPVLAPAITGAVDLVKKIGQASENSDNPVEAAAQVVLPNFTDGDIARIFIPYSKSAQDFVNAFKDSNPLEAVGFRNKIENRQ